MSCVLPRDSALLSCVGVGGGLLGVAAVAKRIGPRARFRHDRQHSRAENSLLVVLRINTRNNLLSMQRPVRVNGLLCPAETYILLNTCTSDRQQRDLAWPSTIAVGVGPHARCCGLADSHTARLIADDSCLSILGIM